MTTDPPAEGVLDFLFSLTEAECNEYTELDLSHNELSNIDNELWQRLTVLEILDLSFNQLTRLNFGPRLVKLRELDLSHNMIDSLDNWLVSLVSLRNVNLSHNRIEAIHPSFFPPKLRRIALHHTPIAATEDYLEAVVAAIPLLEELDGSPLPALDDVAIKAGPTTSSRAVLECELYALNRVVQKQEAEIRRLQNSPDSSAESSGVGWKEETFKLLVQRRAIELKAAAEIVDLRSQLQACKDKLRKRGLHVVSTSEANASDRPPQQQMTTALPDKIAETLEEALKPAEEKVRKLSERIACLSSRTSWALKHTPTPQSASFTSPCCPHLAREITKLTSDARVMSVALERTEEQLREAASKLDSSNMTAHHLEELLAEKSDMLRRTASELERAEEMRISAESDAAAKAALLDAFNNQTEALGDLDLWGLERLSSQILRESPSERGRRNLLNE